MEIEKIDQNKAYNKSIDFLRKCANKQGFHAALLKKENYNRIWARDGVINGLAALMSGEEDLIETLKNNLLYLADFQGKSGQIASNISLKETDVSFGRTAGRVDATLWFIIGCSQYFKRTGDEEFLDKVTPNIDRALQAAESWEFNGKNFIFVPNGGDWADESLRHGYILFDQLLYNQAMEEYIYLCEKMGVESPYWKEKCKEQRNMINTNFWPDKDNPSWKYVYHKQMFENTYKEKEDQDYWLELFGPGTFPERFDAFANILSILFGFSDKKQTEKIIDYLLDIFGSKYLVPAFYPVTFPEQKKQWDKMRGNYSFRFKNKPYEAHNGGLWPMLSGFLIEALKQNRKENLAEKYLNGANYANSLKNWGFYEYHHGKEKTPKGVKHTAWSASGAIIGHLVLNKDKKIFL